jgi:hypothetical protein
VGTWCGILLLTAGDQDPLFLQVKEAGASVLEAYAGKSIYPNQGQRVVNGCRLMQSASDLFLGWTIGPEGRQFYVRQLRDMKISMQVELFTQSVMTQYAELCGWTRARAMRAAPNRPGSRDISAKVTHSTTPSPTSRSPMPIRASATTRS